MSYQENKLMNLKDGRLLLKTLDEQMKTEGFAPVITNEYPDTIKTIENCAENMGMGFEIPISPVQDLNGYANPWVGGAGKNLLQNTGTTQTISGVTFTVKDDGTVVCNGTATAGIEFFVHVDIQTLTVGTSYILNGCPQGGGGSTYKMDIHCSGGYYTDTGSGVTFTFGTLGSGTEDVRIVVYSGTVCNNLTFKPMIRLATETDATFAPYSNICPISGYTGVNITRTGRNLFPSDDLEDGYISSTGELVDDVNYKRTKYIPVHVGQTYTFSLNHKNVTQTKRIHGYYANGSWKEQITTLNVGTTEQRYSVTFTVPSDVAFIRIGGITGVDSEYQLEEGSSASTYEPFGKTYPITWESVGTVYGGTVTINEDGSGKLVVNHAMEIFDGSEDESWSIGTPTRRFYINAQNNTVNNDPNAFCNEFNAVTELPSPANDVVWIQSTSTANRINIYFNDSNKPADVTALKTWLASNPLQVCYSLASPVSYDLAPQQITSLLGNTTVWNSIGTVSVSYHIDPKIYVDDTAGIKGSIAKSDSTEESVKTLTDGADNMPMEVTVAINPIQDLHGQDAPYPAGTGKNLCPIDHVDFIPVASWVSFENTSANTYTNGTKVHLTAGTYYVDFTDVTNINTFQMFDASGNALRNGGGGSFTLSEEQDTYMRVKATDTTTAIKFKIQLETGDQATAWSPYSNICPISGWDSVQISRTGANLLDESTAVLGNLDQTTGAETSSTSVKRSDFMPVKGGQNIYATISVSMRIFWFKNDKTHISNQVIASSSNIEVPENASFFRLVGVISAWDGSIMVNYGTTASAYKPFTGANIYPISLPTTAYGGTLTINKDGSGTIVVDYAFNEYDGSSDESWTKDGSRYKIEGCTGIKGASGTRLEIISNIGSFSSSAETVGTIFGYASGNLYYYPPTSVTSTAEFKTWLASNNLQVLYELATPVEIDFTASQIRSLLGENNLWADSGNVLNVVYSADTKTYIDEQKELPVVTSSDNGKVLRVVDGVWSAVSLPSASGVSF